LNYNLSVNLISMKLYTCQNCGHPVIRMFWFWWRHVLVQDQNPNTNFHVTLKCEETSDCGCPYPKGKKGTGKEYDP